LIDGVKRIVLGSANAILVEQSCACGIEAVFLSIIQVRLKRAEDGGKKILLILPELEQTGKIRCTSAINKSGKRATVLAAQGYDPEFGKKLPALVECCGLQSIRHKAHAEVLRATSPWGRWWLQTLEGWQATDETAGVLTEARKEKYGILTAPWSDASFWFQTAVMHACSARRLA
jgi:hypothetical protein